MEARIHTGLRAGILTLICAAMVFPLAGCQPSEGMAVSPTNPACPLCGGPTQTQAPTALQCTRIVCPICGQMATVDQDFLDRLEVFIGGPIGDTVYACAMCKTAVVQCATCRRNGGSVTSRDIHGWR